MLWRLPLVLCVLVVQLAWLMPARAGLTVDIHVYRDEGGHTVYGWLNTNAVAPAAPLGDYLIKSPHWPTNGSFLRYSHTNGSFEFQGGSGAGTDNFDTFMSALTNGPWTIQVTNAASTNTYEFNVTASGLSSNLLRYVSISYPLDGDPGVPVNPTFTWTGGPVGWLGNLEVQVYDDPFLYFEFETLSPSETSWNSPSPLPVGTNEFFIYYYSNATATIVASIPSNGPTPISGWVSTANIDITDTSRFITVSNAPPASDAGLVAHYTFDNPVLLGEDSSGNGYDLNASGSWNGGDVFDTSDAMAGGGAVEFYTDGDTGGGYLSYDPTPAGLLSVLASNFSISLWLKTSQSFANSGDNAFYGAAVVSADIDGLDYDVLPVALTEGEVAFNTGGSDDYTVNSTTTINDGQYHHIVVTRNQANGEKNIYIDGALNVTDYDNADLLDSPVLLTIGALMDASEPNPAFAGPYNGYEGLLDDLQIYSTVLSADQVSYLFANPGSAVPSDTGSGTAHTNVAHYRFDSGNGLGYDSSPGGNNLNGSSTWGSPTHSESTDAAAGDQAAFFTGNSSISVFEFSEVRTNLQTILADSCSVSLWLKTTNTLGNDTNAAVNGASVIWLYNDHSSTNGVIPIAVSGNKAAFYTGDELGNGSTLHSTSDVTDGNYHHIVVTRDRATGKKKIYVDGALEATENGSTNLLNGNNYYLSIGGVSFSYFRGLVDDVQIYSGVLSATEVTNLYTNPGSVAPDTNGATNPPVDATFELTLIRNHEEDSEWYYCVAHLLSVNVPEITEHRVESPTGKFDGSLHGWGYSFVPDLASLLNECTNNYWRLYINEGDPSQQVFQFKVRIDGVDTNFLKQAIVLSPTNGSVNVPTNPTFTWTGPVGFNTVFSQTYRAEPPNNFVSTNQPGTATNWPSPPILQPGTNRLHINFHTNEAANITFTTPTNTTTSQPINSWSTLAHINSDATITFVVGSAATPVQLISAQQAGTNFVFQFLSENGRTNTVQSRTNLSLGSWQNRTNILGDGTLKTILLPIGPSPAEFFRVLTQ